MQHRLSRDVFPCPSFQSERESGDRNFAIGYYLKEKKVRTTASFSNLDDK